MTGPTPLPATPWQFPPADEADEHGVVGFGADLEPATLVHAYRHALFPMPVGPPDVMAWWSPPQRGILDFGDLIVSRSLRRSCRRYEVSVNVAFDRVIDHCAHLPRDGGWITSPVIDAYRRLHQLGWAHSVEAWDGDQLVGGLYGVQINGLFAGESMFHLAADASKVALVALVSGLEHLGGRLLDVQWNTAHLATLGVREITRGDYLVRLNEALQFPASSLANLSGKNSLAKSTQYLDRIRLKPTGSSPS